MATLSTASHRHVPAWCTGAPNTSPNVVAPKPTLARAPGMRWGCERVQPKRGGSWCPQVLHGASPGQFSLFPGATDEGARGLPKALGLSRLGCAPAGEQGLVRERRDSIRELKCQIIRNTPANPIIVRRLQLRTVMKQLLMSNCKAVINFSFSGSQTTTS